MTVIYGTQNNDTLNALGDNDQIFGYGGNDILHALFSKNKLYGGLGNDIYYVTNPDTIITENSSEGTDEVRSSVTYTLPANVENLTLIGSGKINGTGNDLSNLLTGNSEDNIINGAAGNDTIDGSAGNDTMVGGRGNDIYRVDNTGDVIIERPAEGTDSVNASCTYTLPDNVERLYLIAVGDKDGYGNNLNNFINGNCYNNYLYGGLGNDTIFGSWKDDTLDGGPGADYMDGGPDNDTYIIDNTGDKVIEIDGNGIDNVFSSISYTLTKAVENLTLTGTNNINGAGNNLDNIITGNTGSNILNGGDGNDTLYGEAGNDRLIGGNGNDSLLAGMGIDTLIGGRGNDTYYVSHSSDIIYEKAGEGTDIVYSTVTYTLSSNVENLILSGSDNINATGNIHNNIITGNTGSNMLAGAVGNDTIDGGAGNDTLAGGSGNDSYIFNRGYGQNVILESSGIDTVIFGQGININDLTITKSDNDLLVVFSDPQDQLLVKDWYKSDENKIERFEFQDGTVLSHLDMADMILQVFGNDSPYESTDIMVGGKGPDVYFIDNNNDVIVENSNEGTDEVHSYISYSLAPNTENLVLIGSGDINGTGNELDNCLIGNAGNNILRGEAGNDSLYGSSGLDTLIGGTGDDKYLIDAANVTVIENSNEGIDEVYSSISYSLGANVENLVLTGNENINGTGNMLNNSITGNNGNNVLVSGAGNDVLNGGIGADTMYGGSGNDSYNVDDINDLVIEYGGGGTDVVYSSVSYTLVPYIEKLILTGTDNINGTGNSVSNQINGNSGDNVLSGAEGNDKIYGLDGNDTIDGGTGADEMYGGYGHDIFYVDNTGDKVYEYSGQGYDEIRSSISYTLGNNLEYLTLIGTNNINGTGNNLNNIITGNSANNVIDSGIGHDTLIGGAGNDTLMGGRDSDTYTGYDQKGFGYDIISDYSGTEERIELGAFHSSEPELSAIDTNKDGRVDSLLIDFGNQDVLQVNNYFNNASSDVQLCGAGTGHIEVIHFSNGDFNLVGIQSML